jgi:hypothetical protein
MIARSIATPIYTGLRMTIPVREALERAGNEVAPDPAASQRWAVALRAPPAGLVLVRVGADGADLALRMEDEPEWPGEWRADSIAWHEVGDWTPCPTCGAALVWYEAGYVPGYRICLDGHHAQLSADGRSALANGRKGLTY